jgi:hypothetical protein
MVIFTFGENLTEICFSCGYFLEESEEGDYCNSSEWEGDDDINEKESEEEDGGFSIS